MNEVDAIEVSREAVIVMLKVAGPIMALALIVGLIISLLQALTQIQEQTLTFVPKILLVFGAVLILMPFMLAEMTVFTQHIADRIIVLGGGG
ncbi:MAG: flagellar biosynthesis protein FliQ [Azospirillum sp.]|nr:flagellar biosynthesis protein FliQ [Azospirillum sp.]